MSGPLNGFGGPSNFPNLKLTMEKLKKRRKKRREGGKMELEYRQLGMWVGGKIKGRVVGWTLITPFVLEGNINHLHPWPSKWYIPSQPHFLKKFLLHTFCGFGV